MSVTNLSYDSRIIDYRPVLEKNYYEVAIKEIISLHSEGYSRCFHVSRGFICPRLISLFLRLEILSNKIIHQRSIEDLREACLPNVLKTVGDHISIEDPSSAWNHQDLE